jgi:hypothetical protein
MDQPKPDAFVAAQAERNDKPLGRGLEDISRLFLSRKMNETTSEPLGAHLSDRAPAQSASLVRTVLLQSCKSVSREALAGLLGELYGSLEEGLRLIGACVPCHPYGEIDLLALDRANQFTIIDFDTASNNGLLLRGMSHFDWVVNNVVNLRRMYASETISTSVQPRLFLLAPEFSSMLTNAGRHIASPRIEWVRYHVVSASGALGMLFENVSPDLVA